MHNNNIIHRNLSPSKLLLMNNFKTLKICGSDTITKVRKTMTMEVGNAPYMAPEVCIF